MSTHNLLTYLKNKQKMLVVLNVNLLPQSKYHLLQAQGRLPPSQRFQPFLLLNENDKKNLHFIQSCSPFILNSPRLAAMIPFLNSLTLSVTLKGLFSTFISNTVTRSSEQQESIVSPLVRTGLQKKYYLVLKK